MIRAIILAAGEGARLGSSVPPFHKPLIVVNGKTLIGSAAYAVQGIVDSVTVVVSPTNAAGIVHVTKGLVDQYIVQPEPIGPGDALRRAMEGLDDKYDSMLVLMGDNTVDSVDVHNIVGAQGESINVIGTRAVGYPEALRFTRMVNGEWYEGFAREDERYDRTSAARVWLGPILMNVEEFRKAWAEARTTMIGPAFKFLRTPPINIDVNCEDIGIPEEMP